MEDDLWEKYFSKFLPTDFFERFNEFSSNRNHIAHNKIIDRQAYYIIKKSIKGIKKDLQDALLKVDKNIMKYRILMANYIIIMINVHICEKLKKSLVNASYRKL